MVNLTWTQLPTSTPDVSIWSGVFSSPVTFVTAEQTELTWPWTTYFEGFNAAGALQGFCLEYAGNGYTYQGGQLADANNCMSLLRSNTYQFTVTGDISRVVMGSYLPEGPPANVSWTIDPPAVKFDTPVSAAEPGTLLLLLLGLSIAWLVARYRARMQGVDYD